MKQKAHLFALLFGALFFGTGCAEERGAGVAAESRHAGNGQYVGETNRAAAIDWIRSNAVRLESLTAGNGFADLLSIAPAMSELDVLGLGEATHGTREFFQFKHRMLEYLVEAHGFRVFGIEANYADCLPINHYVLTGEGDPEALVHGMNFWTWDTEEVLELVLWMRAYNEANEQKIYFHGYDAQWAPSALKHTIGYLRNTDPERAEAFAGRLSAYMRSDIAYEDYSIELFNETDDRKLARHDAAKELLSFLDDNADRLTEMTGREAFAVARAAAFNAERAFAAFRPMDGEEETEQFLRSFNVRDRAMADLVLWSIDAYEPGLKAVLWAHNGHVQNTGFDWAGGKATVMGMNLKDALGDRYASLGFGFGSGGLQARGMGNSADFTDVSPLREFTVGVAPPDTLDGTMLEAVSGDFLIDLSGLPPSGPARAWFETEQLMRIGGGTFADTPPDQWSKVALASAHDFFVFVEETTRARPLERTRQRFDLEKNW